MFASYRSSRWAAAVFVACLLYLLYLLFVRPLLPYSVPGTVDLRVTNFTPSSNGVVRVLVVLTNSTPLLLNVQGDSHGKPAFILDDGGGSMTWLTHDRRGSFRSKLASRSSLTNVVFLTNAPPRFRLILRLRDLGDDPRRRWPLPVWRLLPEPWRTKFIQWDLDRNFKRWAAASGWIVPELPRNMQPSQP
jgi:hypothetical protein